MTRKDRKRRGWATGVAWAVAGCCVPAAAAWPFSRWSYLLDVAASYQSLALAAIVAGGLVCAVLRRPRPLGVCLLAAVLAAWPLARGRALTRPAVILDAPPAGGDVRVVSFNIGPLNPRWREDLQRVLSWHPDVVVVIEPTWGLVDTMVRESTAPGMEWGHCVRRAWVDGYTSAIFILSRWPLERLSFSGYENTRDVLVARVDRPEGAFLVATAHPHSPRTPERWAAGNEVTERSLRSWTEARADGLPLMLAVDLNAGPAAWRGRALRAEGLRATKPLLGWPGSFPVGGPGVIAVQLDDVWVDPSVRVGAWSSCDPIGSDHRVVIVDVTPPPRAIRGLGSTSAAAAP